MADKFTNEDWLERITRAERDVSSYEQGPKGAAKYPAPAVGSPEFYKTIDHTLLKLDATEAQFDELCAEAKEFEFATVCVRPPWVKKCVLDLQGTGVKVASVIGFHEGTYDLSHKLSETQESVNSGAGELDLVINYPQLKTGRDYTTIYNELSAIRNAAPRPVLLKLILETSQLSRPEIIAGCVLAAAAEFDFVKTATGFNGHGATEEHVRLMAACCAVLPLSENAVMQVKASGGVRSLADALHMLSSGATRLGTSAGVKIAKEAKENGGKPAQQTSSVGSAEY